MKRAGHNSIWEYRISGVKQAIGTQEEIAKEIGLSVISLRTRCSNVKNHEMVLIKDSRPTYKMIINNNVVAEGTIKHITDIVPYSYSHVINVARGQRSSRDFILEKIG